MKTVLVLFTRNFIFLLLLLVAIAFLNVILHIFFSGWGIDYRFFKILYEFLDPVIYRIDSIFLKIGYNLNDYTGVPVDNLFSVLLLTIIFCFIFFLSVAWVFIQRKNTDASVIKLGEYTAKLRDVVRVILAIIMFYYGIRKVFLTQMTNYRVDQFLTPLGFFSKGELMWTFIGISKGFQFFLGISETIVSFLLLFRKTALLGILISFAIATNICVMNFSYDVPARILSSLLMLMIVFLLIPYIKNLYAFFIQGKAVQISFHNRNPLNKKGSKIFDKTVFAVIALLFATDTYLVSSKSLSKHNKPPAIIYQAEIFISGGDTIPSLANTNGRWNFLVFRPNQMLTIIYSRGSREDFKYRIDSVQNKLSLFNYSYFDNPIPVAEYKIDKVGDGRLVIDSRKDSLYTKLQFIPDSVLNFEIKNEKSWTEKLPVYSVK